MNSGLWGVVPVKDLADAKQRLIPALSPAQRHGLFRAMVEDVLTAMTKTSGLAGVLVVTRDAWAEQLAQRLGAELLREPENLGQTAAVSAAADYLKQQGAEGMMAIPGDVPLVTAAEIEQVVHGHGTAPAVTIVPARDELGSNAVTCSPPNVLPLRFGDNSFFPHLDKARSLGIEPTIIKLPGIGLDIDRPDDLQAFMAQPSATQAYAYMQTCGDINIDEEQVI